MDAGLAAASRSLAAGDVLGALKFVSTRADAPALAMRGIVMARLGEIETARDLLVRAEKAFARRETIARARCVVARAEIDLADRRLAKNSTVLASAIRVLDRSDPRNAAWARLVVARRAIVLGDLDEALATLDRVESNRAVVLAVRALAECEIALRRLDPEGAEDAVARAREAAVAANAPELEREVAALARAIELPVARVLRGGVVREARLRDVRDLERFDGVVVDVCRRAVRGRDLRTRPIPLAIVRVLAEAWPNEATRSALVLEVFGVQRANESHRARLRVEVGRARKLARVGIEATAAGFRLVANDACVLAPPDTTEAGDVLAFLEQGGAWPVSSLAIALGKSTRTVQRALGVLAINPARVESIGKGRAQRWVVRSRIASRLLLPGLLASGS